MTAPATLQRAPLCLDNAQRAYLAYDAADADFQRFIETGQGDGAALIRARWITLAAFVREDRKNRACRR